jgi:hypothetical protein
MQFRNATAMTDSHPMLPAEHFVNNANRGGPYAIGRSIDVRLTLAALIRSSVEAP